MFKGKLLKNRTKSLGQGMTEYAIIVAVIAIAAIGIFTIFGNVVKDQVETMATEMAGDQGSGVDTSITNEETSLKDYQEKN